MRRLLVTGAAGFIGANFVQGMFPPLQRGVRGDFVGATVSVAMPLIPIPPLQRGLRGDFPCPALGSRYFVGRYKDLAHA